MVAAGTPARRHRAAVGAAMASVRHRGTDDPTARALLGWPSSPAARRPRPATGDPRHAHGRRPGLAPRGRRRRPACATTPRRTRSSAGAAVNAFGLDLYARLVAADAAANLVLSPASIALALAMARAGARGHDRDRDGRRDARPRHRRARRVDRRRWTRRSTRKTATYQDARRDTGQEVTLRIGQRAVRAARLPARARLPRRARRSGSGPACGSWTSAGHPRRPAARSTAGSSDQTEQRIPELLAQGTIDDGHAPRRSSTRSTSRPRGSSRSRTARRVQAPFTRLDGTTIDVADDARAGGAPRTRRATAGRRSSSPYVGGKLSMLVIVPDDLAAFEATLDEPALAAITAALASRGRSTSRLPKFGTESQAELGDVLAALGMPTAFDVDAADFSGHDDRRSGSSSTPSSTRRTSTSTRRAPRRRPRPPS